MSYHGLGALVSASFDFGGSSFGSGGGGGAKSNPMSPCASRGGTHSFTPSGVPGGYTEICNDGWTCKNTSDITLPICSQGPKPTVYFGGPLPTKQTYAGFFPTSSGTKLPYQAPVKIGATGTNRPGPSASKAAPAVTYFPSSASKTAAPPTVTRLVGPNLYRMPSGALVEATPGGGANNNGGEDVIGEDKTKTYLVIGLGLLVAAGVGYVAYKKSRLRRHHVLSRPR